MAKGVLVDTSFLITLADRGRDRHSIAQDYWRYFKQNNHVIYLSVIVVSEFCVKQEIPDEIRRSCVPVMFNWDDATRAAKFHEVIKRDSGGSDRVSLKDDIKILAQAAGISDVELVITDDVESFALYGKRLLEMNRVSFKTIALRDGFHMGPVQEPGFFDAPSG